MPNVNNEFLNYSDKERKATDSANLSSISSSSSSVDAKATITNQHLAAMDVDLDRLATISSQLSTITGKLDQIIDLMTPEEPGA